MRNIIFLDIDGVLNHQAYYESDQDRSFYNINGYNYEPFDLNSKSLLNKLIEETDAKIVISSSWRGDGLDQMRAVWEHEKMSGEVIDITPHYNHGFRGLEIDSWLRKEGFSHINWSIEKQHQYMEISNIRNYIIIDDDSDMTYWQRNHFVHVKPAPRNMNGFNEFYFIRALRKLKFNDIYDLNCDEYDSL